MANPRVYFDITISNKPIGRVVMELFADTTPHTTENFRALCTGEKGVGSSGKLLHYKGSTFHKVYPGSYCMGGDITFGNDVGGESIYGANFAHENYVNKHTGMGILSMVNTAVGSKYNNSQFFICTDKMASFDGKCVAFGQVVEGIDVVTAMEKVGSGTGKTSEPVVIADCGQLLLQTMPKMLMSPQKSGNELEQVKRLKDSLKRCKEEYEELIEGEDVKPVIEPNKVKDAHDLKVELKELMDMEENMKQCFEAMSELKKQMCLWEEYSKKRSSETQTKIANTKSSILILEAIQHLPYENILSIESAIKKRKTCSQ